MGSRCMCFLLFSVVTRCVFFVFCESLFERLSADITRASREASIRFGGILVEVAWRRVFKNSPMISLRSLAVSVIVFSACFADAVSVSCIEAAAG